MTIYLIIIFLAVLLMFLKENKMKKIIEIALIFLVFFVLAFRKVGIDYFLYRDIFNNISSFTSGRLEWIIVFIMQIVKNYKLDYQYVCIIFSIITLFNFVIEIYRRKEIINNNTAIFVFLTLGFYTNSFNIMKQMVAVSFAFVSLRYIKTNQLLKFCCMILLGSLFHKTILIFLPLFFICKFFNPKIFWKISLIATIGAGIFYTKLISLLNFTEQYALYSTYSTGTDSGLGTYLGIIMYSILIFLIYKNRKKLESSKIIPVLLTSVPIMFLSIFNNLFMRICIYYFTAFIYLLPELFNEYNKNGKKIINYILICIFIGFYVLNVIYYGSISPYVFNIMN